MSNYIPPFEITNEMLDRVASIMEKIGKLGDISNLDKTPYLRKQKKISPNLDRVFPVIYNRYDTDLSGSEK